jgi:putative nucleotidyltransferase with HDIG domain
LQYAAGKEKLTMIPTETECYALMDRYGMLANIKDHSIVVAEIVRVISQGLVRSGVPVSIEMAVAGALLHDIGKTQTLQTGGDHAALGREICLQHHFDEIADIVGEHVRLKSHSTDGTCSEKEIVYYADKRVLHTSVVSIEERKHDILARYGRNDLGLRQRICENFRVCEGVEERIFSKLRFRPDELADVIREKLDVAR